MKCDVCTNEATVFLTQIINGQMTTVNLCDACSKEKGVTDPTGFQLADFLIGAGQKKAKSSTTESDDTLACGTCGFTRAHLKKIGRLGCPDCYQTFSEDLDAMLRAMHKGTRHIGKTPGKGAGKTRIAGDAPVEAKEKSRAKSAAAPIVSPKKRLVELKDAIDKAVTDERYEEAAKLRDEMRALEATQS